MRIKGDTDTYSYLQDISLAAHLFGQSDEQLDYIGQGWEPELAESWESSRFGSEGGDLADETWDVVQADRANARQ